MNELNEDIDHLFRDVVEPSEMQPSQMVWASVEKKLDNKQYNKLQKKYGRVFNFSIGISVVVISLVFLILNQNLKKKDGVSKIENAIENNQPLTTAEVGTENTKSVGAEKIATSENLFNPTSSANATNKNGSNQLATTTTNKGNNSEVATVANNNISSKPENTSRNTSISNNNSSTPKPSTSVANVGSAIASQNNVAPALVKESNSTSAVINSENKNSTTEVVIKKNNLASEPSVNVESEKTIAEEKNNTENKTHSEHKRSMSSDINLPEPTVATTDVVSNTTKSVAEEKNSTVLAKSSENNSLNASSTENTSAQNTSITTTTTEASLGSSPIVNNTELLNSTSASSSENKTDEVKNISLTVDTAFIAKNANDTAGTNGTAQNPLNGLIPIKDFKFFMEGYFSCDKLMTKLFDVSTTSGGSIHESQKVDFSAGLRFGYCLTKHWSLLTGVVYSTATNYFDFNKVIISSEEESEDEGERITNYNFATSFGVIDMPVTNSVIHHVVPEDYSSAQLNVEGKQKLTYISIPLEARFTMEKNRWSCFIDFGITTNMLVSQKTEVTELNTGVAYSPDINGLKKAYLTAGLGVGVQYRIVQRLSVFIEPTYRQGITPMNKEVPKKTYPSFFGIAGGLAVHF